MAVIKATFSRILVTFAFSVIFLEEVIGNDVTDDWFLVEGGAPKIPDKLATLTELFSSPDDSTVTTTTTSSTADYKFDVLSPHNIFYAMPYKELVVAAKANPNACETLVHRHYQCIPDYFFFNPLVSDLVKKIGKKDISTLTFEEKFLLIRMRGAVAREKPFIEFLQKQADEEQNAEAQYLLGFAYDHTYCGFTEDKAEAVKWYRPSADQGHAGAQFSLGLMYRDGLGGLQADDPETVKLFTLSANQGYAQAQLQIGYLHDTGTHGVQQDKKEAVRYYQLSANQGYCSGQNNLGTLYKNGSGGLEKDDVEAIKFYSLAALQRCDTALENLKKNSQEQALLVTIQLALDGHYPSREELQLKIIPSPQEEYPFPEPDFEAVYEVFTTFEGETLYWSSILGSGMDDMCGANPLFEQLTKSICDEIGLYKKILDHCKVPGTLITCLTADDIVPSAVLPSPSQTTLPPLFYEIRGTPYISVTDAPVDRLIPEDKKSKESSQISLTFFKLNQFLLQTYQLLFENKQKGRPREMLEVLLTALRISGNDLGYFVDSYLAKFPKGLTIEEERCHLDKILKHLEDTLHKDKTIAETLENMVKKLINIIELTTEYRNLNFIKKIVITK